MNRAFLLLFACVAIPLGAPLAQALVPGFVADATYWEGDLPRIQVSVRHTAERDRVSAVELVKPSGDIVYAHRLESESISESYRADSGPSVGFGIGGGFGVGGGSHVGTGIGIGVPLGGGYSEERFVEVRTEAEIAVTDAEDYRAHWPDYAIRISVRRNDGTVNVARIAAPRP